MARARRLLIRMTDGTVHDCEVQAGAPFVIGRGKDAHLRIDLKSVSRQHCRLEVDDETGALSVVDMGSQNGTLLNGHRIDRALVRSGDRVQCGVTAMDIELPDAAEPLRTPRPRALTPMPAASHAPSPSDEIAAALEQMGLTVHERVELGSPVAVYRAHRADLDQDVRVKAVRVDDEESAGRLLREAKLAAKMRHPGIVQIYDVRRSHGLVVIIYEWVVGRTLAQEIARRRRIDPVRALEIGAEVTAALGHAHLLGIVHRNITPATIVLTATGEAKIVDFGLAKGIGDGARSPSLTRSGRGLGAIEYAPPEQVRDAATVDHRADIYAVGSTLYHALAGEPPLVAVSPHAPDDLAADVPAPLGDVSPDVPLAARAIVDRAMAPRPERRFESALVMLRAIEAAAAEVAEELDDEGGTALIEMSPDAQEAARARRVEEPQGIDLAEEVGAISQPTSFVGRIRIDELVEILQMVEHNRKSGTLQIFGSADAAGRRLTGTILFREGRIIVARAADRRGGEALMELLSLRSGDFSVLYGEPVVADADAGEEPLNISATLMDVLRRRDESKKRRPVT